MSSTLFIEQVQEHRPLLEELLQKKVATMLPEEAASYAEQALTMYEKFNNFDLGETHLEFIQRQVKEYILMILEYPTVKGTALPYKSDSHTADFFNVALVAFQGRDGKDAVHTRFYGSFADGKPLTEADSQELVAKARELLSVGLSCEERSARLGELFAGYDLTAALHHGEAGDQWGGTASGVLLTRERSV